MIDKKRVKIELRTLAEICQELTWDLNEGWIEMHGLTFPPGWNPRIGALRFELPDTYPGNQPNAYLPAKMRYRGRRPHIMLRSGPPGWSKFCLHRLDLDANFDTLVSLVRLIEKAVERPHSKTPTKN